MPHQVFISYSSRDEVVAREVAAALEADRLGCWYASRDIKAGQNYQESIVRAIRGGQVLVLLFSANANASREVLKELSVAGSAGVPVLPLRLAGIAPSEGLVYELSTCQWIDGWPDRQLALSRLTAAIMELIGTVIASPRRQAGSVPPAPAPPPPAALRPEATMSGTMRAVSRPGLEMSEPALAALHDLLAWHVGPIARLLLRRAKAEAVSVEDFCERLAGHLPGPAERDSFLREARSCVQR